MIHLFSNLTLFDPQRNLPLNHQNSSKIYVAYLTDTSYTYMI